MKTSLRRIGPGAYETRDGVYMIRQGERGLCSWGGQWVVSCNEDRYLYTDPLPTLREAREALAGMIAARKAGIV